MREELPRIVLAPRVVRLLTDLSSEMIYPLLPVFLTGVLRAGAVALGTIEGIAESAAAFLVFVPDAGNPDADRRGREDEKTPRREPPAGL